MERSATERSKETDESSFHLVTVFSGSAMYSENSYSDLLAEVCPWEKPDPFQDLDLYQTGQFRILLPSYYGLPQVTLEYWSCLLGLERKRA